MAVQAVVQDGMEVLQAAPMEGIDKVSLSLGLSKLGVHLITVHDLKEVVWSRNCSPRHPCEILDLLVLKNGKEYQCWFMWLDYSLEILLPVPSYWLIYSDYAFSELEFNAIRIQKE